MRAEPRFHSSVIRTLGRGKWDRHTPYVHISLRIGIHEMHFTGALNNVIDAVKLNAGQKINRPVRTHDKRKIPKRKQQQQQYNNRSRSSSNSSTTRRNNKLNWWKTFLFFIFLLIHSPLRIMFKEMWVFDVLHNDIVYSYT